MKEWFRRQPKHFTPAERDNGQQIPDNMWVKCPSCGELTYVKQLNDNLKVCKCGHHMRLLARESFEEEDGDLAPGDPLGFISPKDNYIEKLAEKQHQTGLLDAIISGRGTIVGLPLQIAVAEFEFIGGSIAHMALFEFVILNSVIDLDGDRRPAAYLAAGRPLLRRGHGLVRLGRGRDHRRAGRQHRVRRPAGDRAGDPVEAAAALPDRRVHARARHDRFGGGPI